MLLTGLINSQVIRTAEMMDILAICFVRGKTPGEDVIKLAKSRGIVILSTELPMFPACGKLYAADWRAVEVQKHYDIDGKDFFDSRRGFQ